MSDDDDEPKIMRYKFKVPCPSCMHGVRTVGRMGLRDGRTGTGHESMTCPDCRGLSWIPLKNGEWKGRPKT